MTKDFKWPHKTYYVEVVPFARTSGHLYFDGPSSVPDPRYGDVVLTPRSVSMYATYIQTHHYSTFAIALTPEEAYELVQLLEVKLEAFFRK